MAYTSTIRLMSDMRTMIYDGAHILSEFIYLWHIERKNNYYSGTVASATEKNTTEYCAINTSVNSFRFMIYTSPLSKRDSTILQ